MSQMIGMESYRMGQMNQGLLELVRLVLQQVKGTVVGDFHHLALGLVGLVHDPRVRDLLELVLDFLELVRDFLELARDPRELVQSNHHRVEGIVVGEHYHLVLVQGIVVMGQLQTAEIVQIRTVEMKQVHCHVVD